MPSNSILNIKKDGEWIEIPALKGEDGFSPTATVEKVGKVATITITDINGTTSATIADGASSGGSGEENTIESISVNGTPISVDENKNVDITVPSIDGLTKDADLATVAKSGSYEDLSNKPTIPSLDGYAKTSEIPSKVSELTNDSNYQTAEQVSSTVTTEIAKVVADAPEDLNTLKEMSDWIAGHENDASAMNSAIQTNKSDIVTLQTDKVDKETGKSLLADTDKANYDDAVSKAHTHDNKSVLDGITSDKVTAWDTVNNKVDKVDGKGLSTEDYTTDEKNKLSGIAEGANKTIVDSALDTSSENPVQNKVIAGEINTLKKSVSDGKTKVANAITDKGVETATDATFDVMAENISKIETGGGELHGATLAVSTEESTLFGQTVTLTLNGASVGTTVFADNGTCSFVVQNPGTYTITCGEAHNNVTVTGDNVLNKTVISVELSLLKIVAFATGTDEEIAAMIEAHYNNKINIADYWAVGDTRSVSLSAMSAAGVGESHRAQTVQFVIGDFNHDDLTTPINSHSKAAVTLLQKDCLMDASNASNPVNGSGNTENGYMNSTNTNAGGWKNCARRTWCNNVFFAALPSVWQSMVKTVNKKSGTGGGSSSGTEITADKIFLASEIEIFNSTTYSFAGEGTQYQYYKNATANRYKMPKWDSSYVTHIYWERSPRSGNTPDFCIVNRDGSTATYLASTASGVAPCLCI